MANRGPRLADARHRQIRETHVHLSCGCTLTFANTAKPRRGETLWCRKHRRIAAQVEDCVVAVCQKAQCRFSRNTGLSDADARRAAIRHVHNHPGHVVHVMQNGEVIFRHGQVTGRPMGLGRQAGQLDIGDLQLPPF